MASGRKHPPRDQPSEPQPEQEVFVLSRQAVRELDRLATAEFGIPSILLMENAAFHIADIAIHLVSHTPAAKAIILCGPGNNGGDGFAAARHLHNAGVAVEILATTRDEEYQGDAATNLQIARKMRLPITTMTDPDQDIAAALQRLGNADLIVDALLGTGLTTAVKPPLAAAIQAINRLAAEHSIPVLSVDIPSGLDADTGEPLGAAIEADVTVTLVGLKTGFTTLSAQTYIGDVVIADIGAPRELTERLGTRLTDTDLPHRFLDASGTPPEADEGPAHRRGDG